MNIDVFKAIDQLRAELLSVLDIDSIELQFELPKLNKDKDLRIIIFYKDTITGLTENFSTYIYKCNDKTLTLDSIKNAVLDEMKLSKIQSRLRTSAYSFSPSKK